jgi:beta-lactamase class A
MQRRIFFPFAASMLIPPGVVRTAIADSSGSQADGDLDAALQRFMALPGTKSYLLHVGPGGSAGRIAERPDLFLFTASAYKTFVLGQYLRDVEAGLLSEDEPLAIDDAVRTLGAPVFMDLAGKTTARSVLEAMITHSDNIATDIATEKVGADRVRALIAQAGLSSIRIPDSTRLFWSYVLGAPPGVDLGWPGVVQAYENRPQPVRSPLNDEMTLAGSARDFVSWYEQALEGAFFSKPETLTEFKRIQAMSVQIVRAMPPDTLAYAKGGEFPWPGLNTKSLAGQMVTGGDKPTPVTFCFIVNWGGHISFEEFDEVQAEFFAAIEGVLEAVKQTL